MIPGQTGVGPAIVPGVAGVPGLTTIAKFCNPLVPQELVALTEIFPLAADPVAETVIEFVPAPDVINQFAGNNQL